VKYVLYQIPRIL